MERKERQIAEAYVHHIESILANEPGFEDDFKNRHPELNEVIDKVRGKIQDVESQKNQNEIPPKNQDEDQKRRSYLNQHYPQYLQIKLGLATLPKETSEDNSDDELIIVQDSTRSKVESIGKEEHNQFSSDTKPETERYEETNRGTELSVSGMSYENLISPETNGEILPPLAGSYITQLIIPTPGGFMPAFPDENTQFHEELIPAFWDEKFKYQKGDITVRVDVGKQKNPMLPIPFGYEIVSCGGTQGWKVLKSSNKLPIQTSKYLGEFENGKAEYIIRKKNHLPNEQIDGMFEPSSEEQKYWESALPLPPTILNFCRKYPDRAPEVIMGFMAKNYFYICNDDMGRFIQSNRDDLPLIIDELKMGHCNLLAWAGASYLRQIGIPAIVTSERLSKSNGESFIKPGHSRIILRDQKGDYIFMDPTTVCQQAHGYEPENFDMNKLKQLKNDYSQAKNAIQKRTALRKFLETLPRQAKKQDAPTEYSTITQNNTPNAIYQNTEHANSPRLIEEPAITSILEIDADKPRNEVTDFLVHSGNLFRRFFRNLGRKLPGDYKKGERVLLKNFLDELAKTTEKIPNPSLSYLNPDEAESPLFAFMRDITFLQKFYPEFYDKITEIMDYIKLAGIVNSEKNSTYGQLNGVGDFDKIIEGISPNYFFSPSLHTALVFFTQSNETKMLSAFWEFWKRAKKSLSQRNSIEPYLPGVSIQELIIFQQQLLKAVSGDRKAKENLENQLGIKEPFLSRFARAILSEAIELPYNGSNHTIRTSALSVEASIKSLPQKKVRIGKNINDLQSKGNEKEGSPKPTSTECHEYINHNDRIFHVPASTKAQMRKKTQKFLKKFLPDDPSQNETWNIRKYDPGSDDATKIHSVLSARYNEPMVVDQLPSKTDHEPTYLYLTFNGPQYNTIRKGETPFDDYYQTINLLEECKSKIQRTKSTIFIGSDRTEKFVPLTPQTNCKELAYFLCCPKNQTFSNFQPGTLPKNFVVIAKSEATAAAFSYAHKKTKPKVFTFEKEGLNFLPSIRDEWVNYKPETQNTFA